MSKIPLYFYEPKLVPVLDRDGNVQDYDNPPAFPLPLHVSKSVRVLTAPNELGLSADPENVGGFRATLDLINANRNIRRDSVAPIGSDDLSVMEATTKAIKKSKSVSK